MNLDCLIVGLGNPGPKFEGTRHNIGFTFIDFISSSLNIKLKEFRHQSVFGIGEIDKVKIALIKPLTYMNLSGQAVAQLSERCNVLPSRILVVADDLDLPLGKIRYRDKGGAGGHNGHRSLIHCLKTQDYPRLKIGIGRLEKVPVENFVLGKFSSEELSILKPVLEQGLEIILAWIKENSLGVNKILSLKK